MRWLFALWFVAVIAGCATPPPIVPDSQSIPADALSRTGRFAVSVDEQGGRQHAVQGGFSWYDVGPQGLTLDLTTPLGNALARVEVAADGSAVLTESNGERTRAESADALVARVLGSPIPVDGLRYWLRGKMPAQPAASISERDAQGRPIRFVQAGWQVRVTEFDGLGPVRMQLQRREPGVQDIDVRLVITPAAP